MHIPKSLLISHTDFAMKLTASGNLLHKETQNSDDGNSADQDETRRVLKFRGGYEKLGPAVLKALKLT